MSAAIGIGELQFRRAAAEQLGMILAGMKDQVTASIMPRAASARRAVRVRICSVVRMRAVDRAVAVERLRRDVVDAVDAHDLFDEVGLAIDVRTPGSAP